MLETLAVAIFGVLIASLLRGFTGFGFGLAAVPLLSLVLPPSKVVPLVVTLQVIVGVAGLRSAWHLCDKRAVARLTPGLLIGNPLGVLFLSIMAPNPVRLVIGLLTAASVAVLWRGVRLPPKPSSVVTLGVGMLSGTMSGLASVGGPPIVVYLLALGHDAVRIRATTVVYFMLSAITSLIPMAWRGLVDQDVLIWSAASVPVLFGGSWIGTWAFHRAKPHHHRATALIVLSVVAAMLIVRALIGG